MNRNNIIPIFKYLLIFFNISFIVLGEKCRIYLRIYNIENA